MKAWVKLATSTLMLGLTQVTTAHAQPVAQFYNGKQIRIIVGVGPGGAYDRVSRMVSRHLGQFIPGNPSVIVQNMPGASGVAAANYLYNSAAKDGTVIGSFSRSIPTLDALNRGNLLIDARKFGWIGGLGDERRVCFASAKSGVASARDIFEKELIVGNVSGNPTPSLLNKILKAKFHIIEGYGGSPEVMLALKRGEVQGLCQRWAQVKTEFPDMLADGSLKPLFHMEDREFPDVPGLPSMYSFADDNQKTALRFVFSNVELGTPFTAPPDIPAERLTALRDAFAAMASDLAFIAEATKIGRDVTFRSPTDMLKLIEQLHAISPEKLMEIEKILPSSLD